MEIFDRLAPYIQEYIYSERWEELRSFQVEACKVILDTDANLLLTSGTASGKTEAAFLPALTKIYYEPSESVGILYISPLKALINDQFVRLDYLLKEGNIPVCKWHGDASKSAKNKMLKNPQGVLQITPESLESMLINRQSDCIRLFSDLRFIIIDEVHYFMGSPRGIQLLCLLERVQRLINVIPRRIGLSATLGDKAEAERWLNSGSHRQCITPKYSSDNRSMLIAMECFTRKGDETETELDSGEQANIELIYKTTLSKKCIVFCNTRQEVENVIANLRELAEKQHTKDVYRIHHGSISAVIREDTEHELKTSEQSLVTGATVTLELGIDIGSLDMIAQIGSPFSVSNLAQRIGRCGRRGQRSMLLFSHVENEKNTSGIFEEMNWELLRGIATLQIFLETDWVEPIYLPKLPFAMLYHQTIAFLVSNGEVRPAMLAQTMLTLTPFKNISQDDYKILLRHLIAINHIERTENGGLILGAKGEAVANSYEFFAVFDAPKEYVVKCENETIGTVDSCIPVKTRFALAGRSWECVDVDKNSDTIFVIPIRGKTKNSWKGGSERDIHTKVVRRMRDILVSDEIFRYMRPGCVSSLHRMRRFAKNAGFAEKIVTALPDNQYVIFPWVGTRQLSALYFALSTIGYDADMNEYEPYYILIKTNDSIDKITEGVRKIIESPIDKYKFTVPDDIQIPYKYNNFIPNELLKKQFVEDYIDTEGLKEVF